MSCSCPVCTLIENCLAEIDKATTHFLEVMSDYDHLTSTFSVNTLQTALAETQRGMQANMIILKEALHEQLKFNMHSAKLTGLLEKRQNDS